LVLSTATSFYQHSSSSGMLLLNNIPASAYSDDSSTHCSIHFLNVRSLQLPQETSSKFRPIRFLVSRPLLPCLIFLLFRLPQVEVEEAQTAPTLRGASQNTAQTVQASRPDSP